MIIKAKKEFELNEWQTYDCVVRFKRIKNSGERASISGGGVEFPLNPIMIIVSIILKLFRECKI